MFKYFDLIIPRPDFKDKIVTEVVKLKIFYLHILINTIMNLMIKKIGLIM